RGGRTGRGAGGGRGGRPGRVRHPADRGTGPGRRGGGRDRGRDRGITAASLPPPGRTGVTPVAYPASLSGASSLARPEVPGRAGLSVIAHGGYATVYRAVQVSVDREVAVKVENRTLEGDKDRRRFIREARAAGKMSSHPHVVDLFDVGVTPD